MATSSQRTTSHLEREIRRIVRAAEDTRSAARREGDELRPLGKKARRTRAALLQAAYDEFTTKGYLNTSVQDIHARAGVSLGTYYQYFRDKPDVVSTLVAESVILASDAMFPSLETEQGGSGVRRVIESFVRNYVAQADFHRVWEEVTQVEPSVADFRRQVTRVLESGVRIAIEAGQSDGSIDATLDAAEAARALAAMVDRYCYLTFVADGRTGVEVTDKAVDVLSALWVNALRPAALSASERPAQGGEPTEAAQPAALSASERPAQGGEPTEAAQPAALTRRISLIVLMIVIGGAGIVWWQTRSDADRIDRSISLLDDSSHFGSAIEAGDTMVDVSGLLLEEARSCDRPRPRCDAVAGAAGYAQSLAVLVLRCTAPGRFEARTRLRDLLRAIEGMSPEAALPRLPALPTCTD